MVAVSSIELISLVQQFGSEQDLCGDKKAIQEMSKIFKHDREILITVSYGRKMVRFLRTLERPFHRIYDDTTLKELIKDPSSRGENGRGIFRWLMEDNAFSGKPCSDDETGIPA